MNKSQEKKINFARVARMSWLLCTLVIILISISSRYIHGVHYFIDLFSHFQLQYFTAIIVLMLIGLIIPKLDKKVLVPLALFQVIQFISLLPLRITPAQDSMIENADIFFINANYHTISNDIPSYIEANPIETVVVVEANDEIIEDFSLTHGEPISREGLGAQTCVIFSISGFRPYPLDQREFTYPVCSATDGETILVVIHPYPPFGNPYYQDQIKHFGEISELLNELGEEGAQYILMGDFNSSIYSPVFRREFKQIFKQNNYTWATSMPVMLPIDHAMSNVEIKVQPSIKMSSDHSGLFIDY